MMTRWFRRTAPWQGSAAADMQHTLAVEETLARVRLALVVVSLAVALFEQSRPRYPFAIALLAVLAVYAVLTTAAVHARRVRTPAHIRTLHAVDSAGILALLLVTGGAVSPFSTLLLFLLLAAGYRWGGVETWLTAGVGVVVLAVHAWLAVHFHSPSVPDGHIAALRTIYLGVGGVLIGLMAETERIQRHRGWSVSRILSLVRAEGGIVAAVQSVLDELIGQFRASHAVLVLQEEGHDQVSLWHAHRAEGASRATIRLQQEAGGSTGTYLFPVPPEADAWTVTRRTSTRPDSSAAASVTAFDANGHRIDAVFPVTPLLGTPFSWHTALCLSSISGEGWKGRVFLFLRAAPPLPREQLRYLQVVVRQVGPAIFNLYLQRRLQSRAGVVERARISRELHDGVIQGLIGAEMQIEVLRRELARKLPESASGQLVHIQKILSQEILNVRDLMHLLRPGEVDARRLVEHLADMVERFRHRTGIDARLACEVDEIDLSPRVCRELAAVVQEALANVRKHSGARTVMVRLGRCEGSWQLVVDDNGSGLDFEGYLTHEEMDARRKGPMIIKERVRAIGGRLGIHSHPGYGTRVEITIPGKHHA